MWHVEQNLKLLLKKGRPTSTQKLIVFKTTRKPLEDDIELYTIAEFHDLMSTLGDDIYSPKMALFY
mgnify:CR=1 FL=1